MKWLGIQLLGIGNWYLGPEMNFAVNESYCERNRWAVTQIIPFGFQYLCTEDSPFLAPMVGVVYQKRPCTKTAEFLYKQDTDTKEEKQFDVQGHKLNRRSNSSF